MKPFNYIKEETVKAVLSSNIGDSKYIAGGTNLIDLMKKDIAQPDSVVDVTSALSNKIEKQSRSIRIGAMASNTAVANHERILSKYPLISKAILAGASPQIRNMASTGGNLLQRTRCPYFYDVTTPCNKRKPNSGCSAIHGENRMSAVVGYNDQCVAVHPSDFCVALVALDAKVNILDSSQKNTTVKFTDFHKLPESTPQKDNNLPEKALITSLEIPENSFNKNYAYIKVRDRDSYAFALVSVAAGLDLKNNRIVEARLASGGVAHKPWRWYEAEKFLKGKEASVGNFTQAANIAVKDLKPLSHNGFKVEMLKGAIVMALQNCISI
ncbi:4-hydroxybenzoyl-CoA reductase subunit beta [compost metagenome]